MLKHTIKYGQWTITYNPKPISVRHFDYDFVHDEYDLDSDLCGTAKSVDECIVQINYIEDESVTPEILKRQAI